MEENMTKNTYTLCDLSDTKEEIKASSDTDALCQARVWARAGEYNLEPGDSTIWVSVSVHDGEGNFIDRVTVSIDPPEPICDRESRRRPHDWQSPHSIVGGLEENPGVHGHGGGVWITEICMSCGTERVRDTWAQDPNSGVQGLESVRYNERAYSAEVQELRESESA